MNTQARWMRRSQPLLLLLLVGMLLVVLPACEDDDDPVGAQEPLVGTWTLVGIDLDGTSYQGAYVYHNTLILNEDGTGMSIDANDGEQAINWHTEGQTFYMTGTDHPYEGPYSVEDEILNITTDLNLPEEGVVECLVQYARGSSGN